MGACVELSAVYVSYFRMIYNAEGYGTTEIVFNYDHGMKFQFDAPFYFRLSYDVDPAERYSFVVEDFDLATCPLSMQNFLFRRSFPAEKREQDCISWQSKASSRFWFLTTVK